MRLRHSGSAERLAGRLAADDERGCTAVSCLISVITRPGSSGSDISMLKWDGCTMSHAAEPDSASDGTVMAQSGVSATDDYAPPSIGSVSAHVARVRSAEAQGVSACRRSVSRVLLEAEWMNGWMGRARVLIPACLINAAHKATLRLQRDAVELRMRFNVDLLRCAFRWPKCPHDITCPMGPMGLPLHTSASREEGGEGGNAMS